MNFDQIRYCFLVKMNPSTIYEAMKNIGKTINYSDHNNGVYIAVLFILLHFLVHEMRTEIWLAP